jgi:hypothetical protein
MMTLENMSVKKFNIKGKVEFNTIWPIWIIKDSQISMWNLK